MKLFSSLWKRGIYFIIEVGEIFFCRDGILNVAEYDSLDCEGSVVLTKDAMLCRSNQYQILYEFFSSASSCTSSDSSLCESDTVDACGCPFGYGWQNGGCESGFISTPSALAACSCNLVFYQGCSLHRSSWDCFCGKGPNLENDCDLNVEVDKINVIWNPWEMQLNW